MRGLILILLFSMSFQTWAQDQLMLRLNHSGILQIMKMSLQYNQAGNGQTGFKIPAGLYGFKVLRADLEKNPIVNILNQVSDVNLTKDLPFFISNSEISVIGSIDESSLRTKVSNYSSTGFDLKVSVVVDRVSLSTPDLSLCEDKDGTSCGNGLKASFKGVSVALSAGQKIKLSADFKVNMAADKAHMSLVQVVSNIDTGTKLDIDVEQVVIPPISIVINGQESQLDTSGLRSEILARRDFLAQKLLSFASEFIAEDLAEMVNKALENKCLPTRLRLFEMGQEDKPATDGGFTKLPVAVSKRDPQLSIYRGDDKNQPTLMEILQQDLARIIKSASFDIQMKSARTPLDQDIELRLDGALRMNRRSWFLRPTVGNSSRKLPVLDIDSLVNRADHLAVAISEPMINGSLNLLSSTGVFQELIRKQPNLAGVKITSVKAHFKSGSRPDLDRYYLVANIRVNLREIAADGAWAKIKRMIAVWLERGSSSVLYFPIQLEATPRLEKQSDGKLQLMLKVNSPFASTTALRNDFNYPNSVPFATGIVRDTVLKLLGVGLGAYVNKEFRFPLDSYLSRKGVRIEPKSLRLIDSAYMMLSADITQLDLVELNTKPSPGETSETGTNTNSMVGCQ